MEGSTQEASGQTTDTGSADQTIETAKDKVAYETYSKILGEKKRVAEENTRLKAEMDKLRHKELELSGKDKELVEALRKQLQDEQDSRKKERGAFAYTTLAAQLESAARGMGCVHPDLVMKTVDLSEVQVNEDFTVNQDDLKRVLETTQTKYPELFKKKVEPPRDGVPGSGQQFTNGKVDLSKLSTEQLKAMARSMYGQTKQS